VSRGSRKSDCRNRGRRLIQYEIARFLTAEFKGWNFETGKMGSADCGLFGAMTEEIVFQEGAIEVDARLIAEGLGLDVASLHELMRASKVTSLCERGVDNDLGLHRLTFSMEAAVFALS
jgi:hypothetical protein